MTMLCGVVLGCVSVCSKTNLLLPVAGSSVATRSGYRNCPSLQHCSTLAGHFPAALQHCPTTGYDYEAIGYSNENLL